MRGRLKSIQIKHFKAVGDSGRLPLTPLTAFIGNNGSGKSSIIEALQSLQRLVTEGLDPAMQAFKGLEHLRNKASALKTQRRKVMDPKPEYRPVEFRLSGTWKPDSRGRGKSIQFRSLTQIADRENHNQYVLERDDVTILGMGPFGTSSVKSLSSHTIPVDLARVAGPFIKRWQFLQLEPTGMGEPSATRRAKSQFLLDPDGSNLADYLWHLVNDYGKKGTQAWDGIVEALQFVLPYAERVDSAQTIELERRSYLQLAERGFQIPGWMLSTGTVRVLALLAVFRHPDPPPLICIEEVENGLDPRTLRLVVNEIQSLIESKRSQVILTTHSPYLLDMLPLSSVVMTQRTPKGVTFSRPADNKVVKNWADDFAPGQLYMMGRFDAEGAS
ncbi:MAG: AAA family ATPase [Phycisphaerales bacterium]|nr:AAA family ATPase [Phycisphaerales bacterium]